MGDSRAVLVKWVNNKLVAHPLTTDHKPDVKSERERVLANGGRVEAFKDAFGRVKGPERVWHRYEDVPGLAMTRSMGDASGAQVGVIAVPEIREFEIDGAEDWFIVVGSDGIWEFVSNQDAAEILLPYYLKKNAEGAGEAIVKEAFWRWRTNSDWMIDDITAVITFLK